MAAGTDAPSSDVIDYISNLQRDGRLLMRHIARRSDTALPDGVPAGMANDGTPSDVLFVNPNLIAGSAAKLAELVGSIDILSRRAAPANVRSIRLTSAYLHIAVEVGEPPKDIQSEARRVLRSMQIVAFFAISIFLLSVGLLAHIDNGRRMLQQLSILRQQEQDLNKSLVALPLSGGAAQLCRPSENDTSSATSHKQEPITPQAAALCRQDDDLRVRLALTYVGLADWNCLTNGIFRPWNLFYKDSCGHPTGKLPPEVTLDAWRSHEIRVSATTAVVAGFVLPMMLGCLGGCVYALRRLDSRLSNWTLEPHDGKHALVRVGLAALLGGLVGVVWTSDESVKLGGFTLSLAALAFFIGFSVEAVFRVIESLISTVTAGIRSPVVAPPSIPQPSPLLSLTEVRRIAAESTLSGKETLNPTRADPVPPAKKPDDITERMVPYDKIPKIEEQRARARDIDMTRVVALFNAQVTRAIVFDITTRQPIFILRAKSPPMPATWLPNPPAGKKIGDYLQENAGANALDATQFGYVAQTATIDAARTALNDAAAEDLFITATGAKTDPVLGWVTSDLLK